MRTDNAKGTPSPQAPECSFGRHMALPHTSFQVFSRNNPQHNVLGSERVNETSAWTQDLYIWLIDFCIKANTTPQSVSAVAVPSESETCTWMPGNISTAVHLRWRTKAPQHVHKQIALHPPIACFGWRLVNITCYCTPARLLARISESRRDYHHHSYGSVALAAKCRRSRRRAEPATG